MLGESGASSGGAVSGEPDGVSLRIAWSDLPAQDVYVTRVAAEPEPGNRRHAPDPGADAARLADHRPMPPDQ